jgi:hypothetical protein
MSLVIKFLVVPKEILKISKLIRVVKYLAPKLNGSVDDD